VTCKRRGEVPVVGNGVVEFTCMKLSDCSHNGNDDDVWKKEKY
jgi:hypothetical protein